MRAGAGEATSDGLQILARVLTFLSQHPSPVSRLDPDPARVQEVVDSLKDLAIFAPDRVRLSLSVVPAPSEWYIAATTDPGAETGRRYSTEFGLTGWAVRTGRIAHLHVDRRRNMPADVKLLPSYSAIRSAFLWVFRVGTRPVGAVCAVSDDPDAITDDLVQALRFASSYIKLGVVGLGDAIGGLRDRSAFASRAHSADDEPPFPTWVGAMFRDLCPGYEHAYLWTWNHRSQRLEPHQLSSGQPLDRPQPMKLGEGYVGRCAATLEVVDEPHVQEGGTGATTGIRTPHPELREGVALGSILAHPVKDLYRLHGVLAVVSETPEQFERQDEKLREVVQLISARRQEHDERRLGQLHVRIANGLLKALTGPDTPAVYWDRLSRLLGRLEKSGLCSSCAFFVGKRKHPNILTCKSASRQADGLRNEQINSRQDDTLRALLRGPDGVATVHQTPGSSPLRLMLGASGTRYWVKRHPFDEEVPGNPLFLALASLEPATAHDGAFGLRPVEAVLSQVFTQIFATTRAVLTAADMHRVGRERLNVLSAATHDLRAPVASLRSWAGDLSELTAEDARIKTKIIRHSTAALHRIDNLLYQWQFDRQQLPAATEHVEPVGLVRDIVSNVKALTEYSIVLEERDVSAGCYLVGTRLSLGLALQNVIENATKFGLEAPVTVSLRFADADTGMSSPLKAWIQVRDHGIGIRAEDVKTIFEPGHLHKHSREFVVSGAGIGLSITKAIVEECGGKIWPDTAIGKGALFHIVLPLYRK